MTHPVHPLSLNNLKHETFIEMHKRVQAHKWCEKSLARDGIHMTIPRAVGL
jgi:hypothetical protein